jgi:hypothetical protein
VTPCTPDPTRWIAPSQRRSGRHGERGGLSGYRSQLT